MRSVAPCPLVRAFLLLKLCCQAPGISALRRLINADLIAPFNLSREAAKLMIHKGNDRIINITLIAGQLADAGDAVYT
ncbi:hypothetical protein FACHB389_14230 [Nostoc calcicola FACHB-389]|nr:hypothetical protein [Nostoc calcicola FACHB-3891]OKH34803.1 hypothetical protein FACHB389_14230 [Nostoc calcicola FACHB-389]